MFITSCPLPLILMPSKNSIIQVSNIDLDVPEPVHQYISTLIIFCNPPLNNLALLFPLTSLASCMDFIKVILQTLFNMTINTASISRLARCLYTCFMIYQEYPGQRPFPHSMKSNKFVDGFIRL